VIAYAARRLGWAVLTAFVASILAFFLFWTIPNVDPAYKLGGERHGTERSRERARDLYGLEDPLPVQYVRLMKGIVGGEVACFYGCGNLRRAFFEALPVTFSLVLGAGVIAIGTGVGLGLVCARRRGRLLDRMISSAAVAAYSVPSLVLAAVLWTYLCFKHPIFPLDGYVPFTEDPVQWAYHLLLPWIAAAVPFAGAYVQVVRSSLLDTMDEEWVRTARAKGLAEKQVMRRHVLRNALLSPMSLWGLDFSHAFGGFILYVEVIFGLPGIGTLTAQTLEGYDLPPIVGMAVWLAIVVVTFSAIADLVAAWLDPRIRRGRAGGLST
jgi:peptide/nickel transport system permease protein